MEVLTTDEFDKWLGSLRDRRARDRVFARILRIEQTGALGDVKPVGEGVWEMRIDFGPGYRLYYARRGEEIVLLLAGGDKSSQQRDIRKAIRINRRYL